MKIAQIAPIIESVPPKKYGGTERVVSELTEALVKRGHDVTLFASGDSVTTARLISIVPRSMRNALPQDHFGTDIMIMAHIGAAYMRHEDFDIIHDHTGTLGLPTAQLVSTPVVTTYHGPLSPEAVAAFSTLNGPHLVSISNSQAEGLGASANHVGTVYNGLSMESYPFGANDTGSLLCVGRISPEKGTHHAIDVAQRLGMPLIIAAKLDPLDAPYFEEKVKPHLKGSIQWIGEVEEAERNRQYSEARCLLHPVTWPEPFGLVMIEAMACGTPVIGFRLGSIPEVVEDGTTGFVVSNVDEMAQAIPKLESIDRAYCRTYALSRFSAELMAENYEAVYRLVLQRSAKQAPKL